MAAPVPIPRDASYRLEKIDGKGIGAISARTIHVGESIMCEAPSLRLQKGNEHRKDFETSQLKLQLKKVPSHLQTRILALHGAHGYPKKHRVQDIFYTNCFDGADNCRVMYYDISFVNHSCKPNTQLVYDMKLQKSVLRAIREIQEGEELVNDYRGATDSSIARKEVLKNKYGFDCNCEYCDAPPDAVAARDNKLSRLRTLESLPSIPNWEAGLEVLRECSQLYHDLDIRGSALCDFFIASTAMMCTFQLFDRATVFANITKRVLTQFCLQGSPPWRSPGGLLEREDLREIRVATREVMKKQGIWWILQDEDRWEGRNWAAWLWNRE